MYLNDVNTELNTFSFTIIINGDNQIKEIEMEETCRMHETEDEFLKSFRNENSSDAVFSAPRTCM